MKTAILKLKDGKEFKGIAFGAPISLETGEVVFNTGIPGYQEILTDPSYNGQIVTLTSPMIGNYGVDALDSESNGVKATALVIRKLYRGPVVNDRVSLDSFLAEAGIPGLEGVDTRALTLHLREHGSQNGILFYEEDRAEAEAKLQLFPEITERDLITEVAVKEKTPAPILGDGFALPPENPKMHFALVDFGIKRSIIDNLYKRNIAVTLFPKTVGAKEILSGGYDALFLSNGPGDPAFLAEPIAMVKECVGKIPLMGICLGHQLITHALGGHTEKMKFGHHGSNHPVIDTHTGRTFVTAQNHGFMTTERSLPENVEIWLRNANDGTVEGLACPEKRVISIQFHPEAAPGPMEAEALFENLIRNAE